MNFWSHLQCVQNYYASNIFVLFSACMTFSKILVIGMWLVPPNSFIHGSMPSPGPRARPQRRKSKNWVSRIIMQVQHFSRTGRFKTGLIHLIDAMWIGMLDEDNRVTNLVVLTELKHPSASSSVSFTEILEIEMFWGKFRFLVSFWLLTYACGPLFNAMHSWFYKTIIILFLFSFYSILHFNDNIYIINTSKMNIGLYITL